MISDEEIQAKVIRIIRENTTNAPVKMTGRTALEKLVYSKPANGNFPAIRNLMWDLCNGFRGTKPWWVFPEYFNFGTTYKKMATVKDVCKFIRDGFAACEQAEAKRDLDQKTETDLKAKLKNVESIDCDWLLNGTPTWEQVQKFFLEEEFHDEKYLVDAIKLYLRTPKHKEIMDKMDVSIQDMLNGRIDGNQEKKTDKIFADWNKKLGFNSFGS